MQNQVTAPVTERIIELPFFKEGFKVKELKLVTRSHINRGTRVYVEVWDTNWHTARTIQFTEMAFVDLLMETEEGAPLHEECHEALLNSGRDYMGDITFDYDLKEVLEHLNPEEVRSAILLSGRVTFQYGNESEQGTTVAALDAPLPSEQDMPPAEAA